MPRVVDQSAAADQPTTQPIRRRARREKLSAAERAERRSERSRRAAVTRRHNREEARVRALTERLEQVDADLPGVQAAYERTLLHPRLKGLEQAEQRLRALTREQKRIQRELEGRVS